VPLGASVSLQAGAAAGPILIFDIVAVVIVAIGASFASSRLLGLTPKMAILVACGNSICGISAIAAVALVIASTPPGDHTWFNIPPASF
jgi:uncharacterized membrane protein YadS